MKKIFLCLLIVFMSACTTQPVKETLPVVPEKEVNKEPEIPVVPAIRTGWADEDSYTVIAVAEDAEKAQDKAKHRILKDIVTVRVSNGSRYTDITAIQQEFEKPLQRGRVLSQQQVDGGVEIYYQITDKGLRKKFERK